MADVNLGRVQGLTTSITMNGEIKQQVNGNIDIGNVIISDVDNPVVKQNTIGQLDDLTSADKTNIVAAINEVNAKPSYPEIPIGADTKYVRSRNTEDVAVWEEANFEPAGNVGDLTSLTTVDKTSAVAAINEVNAKPVYEEVPEGADTTYVRSRDAENVAVWEEANFEPEGNVGDLTTLTTTDKTSTVAAINEVNAKPVYEEVPEGADTTYVRSRNSENIAVWEEADFVEPSELGDLTTLTTTNKTDAVAAINEVNAKLSGAVTGATLNGEDVSPTDGILALGNLVVVDEADPHIKESYVGDLAALTTTNKTDVVVAINEVNAKPVYAEVPEGADVKYVRSRNTENIAVWEEASFEPGGNVGDLTTLTTTDKSSTVAAINEVNAKPVYEEVPEGADTLYVRSRNAEGVAVWTEADFVEPSELGDLTALTTVDKASAVAAINEVNSKLSGTVTEATLNGETISPTEGVLPLGNLVVVDEADPYIKESYVGDLTTLTTTDKTDVVVAINEVNAKPVYAEVPEGADTKYVRSRNAEDLAVWEEANFEPSGNVGDLATLTTTDKTTVVNAINELVVLTRDQYNELIAKIDTKQNGMVNVEYTAEEAGTGISVNTYSRITITEPVDSVIFTEITDDGMMTLVAGPNLAITIPLDMDWDGRVTPVFSENYMYDIVWVNNVFYVNKGV